jgi:hypothetical protein
MRTRLKLAHKPLDTGEQVRRHQVLELEDQREMSVERIPPRSRRRPARATPLTRGLDDATL